MTKPRKIVLGLSHFIGETSKDHDWTLTLDVPDEKKGILNNQRADSVCLYLTEEHGYPVEWIRHLPQPSLPDRPPKIRLRHDGVDVRVPSKGDSGELLASLGFANTGDEWVLASRLFRPLAIRLEEDSGAASPKVDDPGLTTVSLLVKDLDAVGGQLPLISHQRFDLDGVTKEIAFFSGNGLLLEFLMIVRRGAKPRAEASS